MTGTVASPARRRPPTWLVATISGFFGLFYAYAVWNAVGFLVDLASVEPGLSGYGWGVLLGAVFFPILVFAIAFVIGFRRGAGPLGLTMLAGLGLTAVFWLNVVAHATSGISAFLAG